MNFPTNQEKQEAPKKQKVLNARVSPELHKLVRIRAAQEGVSAEKLVIRAVMARLTSDLTAAA